jgi:hypothetical protein
MEPVCRGRAMEYGMGVRNSAHDRTETNSDQDDSADNPAGIDAWARDGLWASERSTLRTTDDTGHQTFFTRRRTCLTGETYRA